MDDSLNDYLSSFFGLKKLDLSLTAFRSRTASHASAVKFWSNCFPNYVDTLQDFSLKACYDDQWCFGNHNRQVVATCTNLKRIKMSLLPDDIPLATGGIVGLLHLTFELSHTSQNGLIDTVVTHMPHAEQIGLLVPIREIYRHTTRGIRVFLEMDLDERRLIDWIPKYKPLHPIRAHPD